VTDSETVNAPIYKEERKGYNENTRELYRYEGGLGIPFTSADFDQIAKPFIVSGGTILRSKEVDEHLNKNDAVGSNFGELIMLHSKADRATLAEEVEHGYQRRQGKIPDPFYGYDLLEIEAKTSILKKYDFPEIQRDQNLKEIEDYQRKVERRNEN
jgi:hypothetical protein